MLRRTGWQPIAPLGRSVSVQTTLMLEFRAKVERFRDTCLDLFVDFVILEERIQGNIEAFEGIRIVKERKHDDTQRLSSE